MGGRMRARWGCWSVVSLGLLLVAVAAALPSADGQFMRGADFGDGKGGGGGVRGAARGGGGEPGAPTAARVQGGAGSREVQELEVDIDDLDPDPPSDGEEEEGSVDVPARGRAWEGAQVHASAAGHGAPGNAPHPPIVVLVHDRAEPLRRLLESVQGAAGADLSLVTVYQDGADRAVEVAVRDFHPARLVRLPESRETRGRSVLLSRLTHNYRFMFEHALAANPVASHLIILEDDLLVSRDAISFFVGGARLMERDPSIFCVSGYNDNGFAANTDDSAAVYRGEHFMALGWLTSRAMYEGEVRRRWVMDEVWDVPFAASMRGRECVFPEIPRTKHVGDDSMRTALTTSAAVQRLWFSNIRLHIGGEPLGAEAFGAAEKGEHEALLRRQVQGGRRVRCLWEMLLPQGQPFILAFEAAAEEPGKDEAWDAALGALGLMGRGGGWDRLPRGVHQGAVRTRVAGNLVIVLSSASPYAQLAAQPPPFPAAPFGGRGDLTTGACADTGGTVRQAYRNISVFESAKSCDELCPRGCDAGRMWAALADPECAVLDEILRAHDGSLEGCSGGCDHDIEGIHSPAADARTGVCMLPTPMAMGCAGRELALVSHKLCPCL